MDQSPTDVGSARIAELLAEILERVDAIDERQAAIEARLEALELGRPTAPRVVADQAGGAEAPRRSLSRRKLLTGAAGLTAAGVAVVAGGRPAAAANGQPVILGADNVATTHTAIIASESATSAIDAVNLNSAGAGVFAQTAGASTLGGPSVLGAVIGNSETQRGVVGLSRYSRGVHGQSVDDTGVYGTGPTGVMGQSNGAALRGVSESGVALAATSGNVHLRLEAFGGRPAPTTDTKAHVKGEVVVDAASDLWYCTASGTPGTWRRLAGPTTAGAFHVLPAPARIYDSRPGSAPGAGPKTPLTATPRVLSCNVNGSGVPAGATAVALTVLLVNAANANGNMTVWANGAPRPQANTMVWGAGSGRFTSSTTSAVDAQTRIQVAASAATDLVLDVVGYYR